MYKLHNKLFMQLYLPQLILRFWKMKVNVRENLRML